jgi:glycosyltransferase involved in cell wall biosynthesis
MAHRIVFFEPYSDSFGGQQRVLLNLIKGIDRDKFEPILVVPQEGRFTEVLHKHFKFYLLQPNGILKERGWQNKDKLSFFVKKPFQIIKVILDLFNYWIKSIFFLSKQNINVVYCNSFRSVLLIGIPAKLIGIPLILHEHGAEIKKQNFILWFCFLISKKVIFVSEDMRQKLVKHNSGEKYIVVHNGIHIYKDIKYSNPNTFSTVCFIGKLTPRKNVHLLIESMAQVVQKHPVSLLIIGDGEEEYIKKLQQIIELRGIEKSIHFLGHQKDVLLFLMQSHLLVLPSDNESFGLVILEAYSVKRPVIATKVGGIPEIVVHDQTGLLIPTNDIEALSNALMKLLTQPELCIKMGEAGYHLLKNNFTVQQNIEQIEKIILQVCRK